MINRDSYTIYQTDIIPDNIRSSTIYCRKSCTSRYNNELSFTVQQHICETFCNSHNLPVTEVVHETASARNTDKTIKLCELLINMDSDTLLVVSDVSRFSRNYLCGMIMLNILNDKKCTVYAVSDNCCYNFNNNDKFKQLLGNAEFESKQMSKRMNISLKYRRNIGSKIGRSRFGYESYCNKKGIRKEKQNKREQYVINLVKKMKKQELTTGIIASLLNKRGYTFRGKEWNQNRINYINTL